MISNYNENLIFKLENYCHQRDYVFRGFQYQATRIEHKKWVTYFKGWRSSSRWMNYLKAFCVVDNKTYTKAGEERERKKTQCNLRRVFGDTTLMGSPMNAV